MTKERELLKRWLIDFGKIHPDVELLKDTKELLAQPEQGQEPVAWILHNKETGYRVQAAYIPSALKKEWEAIPLYAGSPKREQEQHRTQYLLDQVSMLRAENAMLKEKWSTSKQPEQNKAGAIMPNSVCISNVYDAYEEGRKSVMSKQEPVAWIATGIGGGTAVGWYEKDIVNLPKGTKLYLHPPKREPISFEDLNTMWCGNPIDFARRIESIHGIGGGE